MGKKTVEKKKKKKGRPSLLDLQKRNLRLQQEQQQKQQKQQQQQSKRNSNPNFRNPNPNPNSVRRSTRRNPNLDEGERNVDDDDDDDEESAGKRREKKLKLVLRIPPRSSSGNSRDAGSYGSDESDGETPRKKRKINAVSSAADVRGGSVASDPDLGSGSARDKTEKHTSASKATEESPSTPSDSGPGTPLPDKNLLIFILGRLQKKDTYGVFSEPVDPYELPDYHEVIEHPMDFSTVRKKLSKGAYTYLEQFEKDVFLISLNAMRYNAPDTIYFRQARSIHELAKKDFDNLRQDSEDNEPETKIVRRGRPPGKSSIKRLGRPPFERTGSDFSSDATLANAGDNSIWSNSNHDLSRKLSDKPAGKEALARTSSRNGENHGWSAEHKSDRNDDFPGSVLKGLPRFGKKPFVVDENRRNTYKLSQQLASGREPSVLTTFDIERKQLMAVGVHVEHAYARSLARFAMNLGPVAWKVASRKIEKALPSGMKFGPGWVGEIEVLQTQVPQQQQQQQPPQLPPAQSSSQPKLSSYTNSHPLNSKVEKLSEKKESLSDAPSEAHLGMSLPMSTSMPVAASRPSKPVEGAEIARGANYGSNFNLLSGGGFRPKASFQLSQHPSMHTPMNGFNSGYGFNISPQLGKVGIGPARPVGNFGPEALTPRLMSMGPRGHSSIIHQMPANRSEAEGAKLGTSSSINPAANPCSEGQTSSGAGPQSSWRSKSDSVPPDLNVRFQSPGSPSSGVSQQPDLALQL